jgi:hypothetical protein
MKSIVEGDRENRFFGQGEWKMKEEEDVFFLFGELKGEEIFVGEERKGDVFCRKKYVWCLKVDVGMDDLERTESEEEEVRIKKNWDEEGEEGEEGLFGMLVEGITTAKESHLLGNVVIEGAGKNNLSTVKVNILKMSGSVCKFGSRKQNEEAVLFFLRNTLSLSILRISHSLFLNSHQPQQLFFFLPHIIPHSQQFFHSVFVHSNMFGVMIKLKILFLLLRVVE